MKGILFKPDMIKAIVEGRKKQTRRTGGLEILNRKIDSADQPNSPDQYALLSFDGKVADFSRYAGNHSGMSVGILYHLKPRYQIGETVYIKEAIHRFNLEYASYDLDYTPVMFLQSANRFHWRWEKDKLSPMFLPHEAARHFIKITDVRVERLQKITLQDCWDEGIRISPAYDRIDAYHKLWDIINKPPYDWNGNPYVFVYSFKKVEE